MRKTAKNSELQDRLDKLRSECMKALSLLNAFDIASYDTAWKLRERLELSAITIYTLLSGNSGNETEHVAAWLLPHSGEIIDLLVLASAKEDQYFTAPFVIFNALQIALEIMHDKHSHVSHDVPRIVYNDDFSVSLGCKLDFKAIERELLTQICTAITPKLPSGNELSKRAEELYNLILLLETQYPNSRFSKAKLPDEGRKAYHQLAKAKSVEPSFFKEAIEHFRTVQKLERTWLK